MSPSKTRILTIDAELGQRLRALCPQAEILVGKGAELNSFLGKAELFLLDDASAARFLAGCSEAQRPSVVVLASEGAQIPSTYAEGLVDDLLVLPLRALDVERMLRTHEYVQALRDLDHGSHSISGLVRQLQEDIQLAQKIQRRLIKDRFPPLGPLSVKSKYWCGLRAGGDYFDVFEFPDSSYVGVILSDSSSYSLSTNIIGSLMQLSLHVGRDDPSDPAPVARALFGKLRETLKEKEQLSLLYGIIDRKTFQFRFVAHGPIFAVQKGKGGIKWGSRGERPPLSLASGALPEAQELLLEPGDRLLLASDGWAEALGASACSLLEELLLSEGDAQALVNEMSLRLRRNLEKGLSERARVDQDFPMPPQDCSVLFFELASNALRLAK